MAPVLCHVPGHHRLYVNDPDATPTQRSTLARVFTVVVESRIRSELREYVERPDELLDLLVPGKALLTGTIVLASLHPPAHIGDHRLSCPTIPPNAAVPPRCEIVCTSRAVVTIKHYLQTSQGYSCRDDTEDVEHIGYRWVNRVIHLQRGRHVIMLIVPATASPHLWITQLWATHLMNYVDSEGVTLLYPNLTLSKLALLTPSWLDSAGNPVSDLYGQLVVFQDSGFTFFLRHDIIPLALYPHLAPDVSYKPDRERSQGDNACFLLAFHRHRAQDVVPVYSGRRLAIWTLGGWLEGGLDHGQAHLVSRDGVHIRESWFYPPGDVVVTIAEDEEDIV